MPRVLWSLISTVCDSTAGSTSTTWCSPAS